MAEVFISYKKERREHAERLAGVLEAHGFTAFWDYELIVGPSYTRQLQDRLHAARAAVVLWCSGAVESEWVIDEARRAKQAGKLLPAQIELVEPPLGFGMAQTAMLAGWRGDPEDPALEPLIDGVERLVGRAARRAPNMIALLKRLPPLPRVGPLKVAREHDTNAPPRPAEEPAPPPRGPSPGGPPLAPASSRRAGERRLAGVIGGVALAGLVAAGAAGAWLFGAFETHRGAFQDCFYCPEMVIVPAGSFTMGSPPGEESRDDDEAQHPVTIPHAFAVGRYEVTFDEWDACVRGGGCAKNPSADWGRGRQPVINVSWNGAQQYVTWLSRETGRDYRLLTEAEWEYAARAGTTGPFSFGAAISTDQANYNGNSAYGAGWKGVYRGRTTEAGSFPANGFGLHDMHGNVWEWVQDCYGPYNAALSNGQTAPDTADCSRVLRGGSWNVIPRYLRSADRLRNAPSNRDSSVGFRVARTL